MGGGSGIGETYITLKEVVDANIATPPAGYDRLYFTDAGLKSKGSVGLGMRVAIGSFSYNLASSTGQETFTPLNFTPTEIEFIVSFGQGHSKGWDDAVTAFYTAAAGVGAGVEYPSSTSRSIFLTDNYGVTSATANVASFIAGGWKLNKYISGSPVGTATVFYKARG